MKRKIELYDTTLRDGSQAEGVSLSVEDKLRITQKLDELGVHYIEGGWPISNPKDAEYFLKVRKVRFERARIAAFGSTHHAKFKVQDDPNMIALVEAETPVITIFGKTWDLHVRDALGISKGKNLALINNSIRHLKKYADLVFFDAEHFFDGFKADPEYALKCLQAAEDAGADCIIPCDTNGGTLPHEVEEIMARVLEQSSVPVGIHAHNDADVAIANTLSAVRLGASQVQGTINGLGERCGNANLCSIIPSLKLKMDMDCIPDEQLRNLVNVSRYVTEIANMRHFKRQPFVGESAFAHKGGIHVSAIQKNPLTYEHIRPELVGNTQRVLVSDLAGRSNILRKAKDAGIKLQAGSPELKGIVEKLKKLENQGFQYEGAEASFEILMKKALGLHKPFFELIGFRVIVEKRREGEEPLSEATIMVRVGGHIEHTAATGNGPVNALDSALRKALEKFYPQLKQVRLLDYKVRVLTAATGTAANVRVLVESGDQAHKWGTVGVSENIIEASWQALVDGIDYKLLRENAAAVGEGVDPHSA